MSWSESLKPLWVPRSIPRTSPQINSGIVMMKSYTVLKLLFIMAFTQRPVYITTRQEAADSPSTTLQIKREYCQQLCLFSLPALMSPARLPLFLPLTVLHRSTTAAAMLGYINLQPDCAASRLMSESSRIFRRNSRREERAASPLCLVTQPNSGN